MITACNVRKTATLVTADMRESVKGRRAVEESNIPHSFEEELGVGLCWHGTA